MSASNAERTSGLPDNAMTSAFVGLLAPGCGETYTSLSSVGAEHDDSATATVQTDRSRAMAISRGAWAPA